jgi:deoxycytidylate deaminase
VVCTTADGRTVTKSATPTASDITQFVKGFVVGVLDGLWQQESGLWGLLLNLGSLWQLGQDLVHHTAATLKAIAKALGKQFDTAWHIRQELVCEPYDGAKTSGVLLVTLAATLAGEGVANDVEQVLKATSKHLENVAQKTATDTLDLTVVNVGDEAKAVADEFATGKNVVVEISKDTSNVGFAELAKIRYELGLPEAGAAADKSTLAMTEVDGEKIFGISAHGQPVSGVNAISSSHAEIDVLNQIKREGIDVSGQDLTLYVDRAPCAACGQNGGIRSMVEQLGLKKLTVISPDGQIIITPR